MRISDCGFKEDSGLRGSRLPFLQSASRIPHPASRILMSSANTRADGPAYKRILLKASGEALMGAQNYGVDVAVARSIAEEIKAVRGLGVEVAVVVGGGNIFRGVSESAG